MADWKRIKAEYLAGGTSYRKLAEKYGLTLAELRHVAEKEKWVDLRAQAQHKTNTEIVKAVGKRNAKEAIKKIISEFFPSRRRLRAFQPQRE